MIKNIKQILHLKHHPHYFSHHTDTEVNELYWQSVLASFALSFVFIFEPIYLYTLGFGPIKILWFYVLVHVLYIATIGVGAKFASKVGYKHSILLSNIFYVIYWIALFSIRQYEVLYYIAPIFFALQKSFFWPAFNADISTHNEEDQRGREVGFLQSLTQISYVVGPVIGGFISETLGFIVLFVLAATLMLASAYPLFRSSEMYSDHEFKWKNFWAQFKENKQNFFGYWGYAEDMMVKSLWPVFMFIIVPQLSKVGVITTTATLVGAVLVLFVGGLADKYGNRKLIRYGSSLYGISWIFRFLGLTTLGVLFFDVLTRLGRAVLIIPLRSLSYTNADNRGADHAIAYSVFFEFSVAVGKTLICLGGILILHLTGSIVLVFALAGLLTFFYGLLKPNVNIKQTAGI